MIEDFLVKEISEIKYLRTIMSQGRLSALVLFLKGILKWN